MSTKPIKNKTIKNSVKTIQSASSAVPLRAATKATAPNDRKRSGSIERAVLAKYLEQTLNVASFKDYCPNGLQIEGKSQISRLAVAVTASLKAIEAARAWQADALLVHHGLFWKSDSPALVGPMAKRVWGMMEAQMNLFAYHLPLDVHGQWGNNRALGDQLGLVKPKPWSKDGLIWVSQQKRVLTTKFLIETVRNKLNREPTVVGNLERPLKNIAWCTGGAQGYLGSAIELGADAFISGEISEQTTHLAREAGVVFIAAGHHATERYGVQALGRQLQERYNLAVKFFDDDNPA
jgi:dinuclear metal center YbgI/SA1388 family protein